MGDPRDVGVGVGEVDVGQAHGRARYTPPARDTAPPGSGGAASVVPGPLEADQPVKVGSISAAKVLVTVEA